MKIIFKHKYIILFLILLVISNFFLFKNGYWFAQDTSYWPKNNAEALNMLSQQFQVFTNSGYYLGFDQGLFNFTRVLVISFIAFLVNVFGFERSQIFFTLSGYILTFISFYLFSGIFFKNRNTRYLLSLFYSFNPLSYTLQGHVFYNAAVPLFLYSFHNFFYNNKKIRILFLLLSVLASFIWISYIRFVQSNLLVIVPYVLYFFFQNNKKIDLRKLTLFLSTYLLIFAPVIYSFLTQLFEKSQTGFFYGSALGKFVDKISMVEAFNIFQTIGVDLYSGKIWTIVGILFFIAVVILFITLPRKAHSSLILMNFSLILLSVTLYGLSNVVGEELYLRSLSFLPFIINGAFFAHFIMGIPLAILLGLLTKNKSKYLYLFVFLFIAFATLPFFNLSDPQFRKFNIVNLPAPYKEYFIKSDTKLPESTYYFLKPCWRAEFMNKVNKANICVNWGLSYSSAIIDNPRLVAGDSYKLSNLISSASDISNMQVTHNLKNIILPVDAVDKKEKQSSLLARIALDNNPSLASIENENFIHYFFKNKNLYDFFIYSPEKTVFKKSIDSVLDNSLHVEEKPYIISSTPDTNRKNLQNAHIDFKISPISPTKYYLHISGIDQDKPFAIQFNQEHSPSWKIKVIDKLSFDRAKCKTPWENFYISNNKRCEYQGSILDLGDLNLLANRNLNNAQHIKSNFINNGWIIGPQSEKEVYLIIINEKQIYYTFAILTSGITFMIILVFALIQEMHIRPKNKI